MAVNWIYFNHLDERGVFSGGAKRLLDIGAQNFFHVPVDEGLAFLKRVGSQLNDQELANRAWELSRRAQWPPSRDSLFLHEFFDGTPIDYTGFDIFPGAKTQIFDLNFQALSPDQQEQFDIVLNFGTTEHVFNQYNCFKVIHEAAKPGAYMFHQVPCTGWLDHGYWVYSPRVFMELAEANGYEVCELWCSGPLDKYRLLDRLGYSKSATDATLPENGVELWRNTEIADGLVNALLRKRTSAPFKLGLDITTSGAGPDEAVFARYFESQTEAGSGLSRTSLLRLFTAKELGRELAHRIRRRLSRILERP